MQPYKLTWQLAAQGYAGCQVVRKMVRDQYQAMGLVIPQNAYPHRSKVINVHTLLLKIASFSGKSFLVVLKASSCPSTPTSRSGWLGLASSDRINFLSRSPYPQCYISFCIVASYYHHLTWFKDNLAFQQARRQKERHRIAILTMTYCRVHKFLWRTWYVMTNFWPTLTARRKISAVVTRPRA